MEMITNIKIIKNTERWQEGFRQDAEIQDIYAVYRQRTDGTWKYMLNVWTPTSPEINAGRCELNDLICCGYDESGNRVKDFWACEGVTASKKFNVMPLAYFGVVKLEIVEGSSLERRLAFLEQIKSQMPFFSTIYTFFKIRSR